MDTQSISEFLEVWRSASYSVILQYPTSTVWQVQRDTACRNLRTMLLKICQIRRCGGDWLERLDVLDIASICNQLLYTLHSNDAAQVLLDPELTGGLQSFLYIIQMFLDQGREPSLSSVCLRTLLELCETYNVYPADLILHDIFLEGSVAFAVGSSGEVWRGVYRTQLVAVKILRVYRNSDLVKHQRRVSHETLIWRQLCHPNVLPLVGLYYLGHDPTKACLVSPWMENGNVHQYLSRYPNADRVGLVIDVAAGLNYLHSGLPKIIHGDLKGINILITVAHTACIADFGVSALTADACSIPWPIGVPDHYGGTLRWFAPEKLDGSQSESTLETDIYAFACVCYEVFSGKIPFYEHRDGQVILLVTEGRRPCRPWFTPGENVPLDDDMWGLIKDCWRQAPSARPTSREILERLYCRSDVRHRVRPTGNYHLECSIHKH